MPEHTSDVKRDPGPRGSSRVTTVEEANKKFGAGLALGLIVGAVAGGVIGVSLNQRDVSPAERAVPMFSERVVDEPARGAPPGVRPSPAQPETDTGGAPQPPDAGNPRQAPPTDLQEPPPINPREGQPPGR